MIPLSLLLLSAFVAMATFLLQTIQPVNGAGRPVAKDSLLQRPAFENGLTVQVESWPRERGLQSAIRVADGIVQKLNSSSTTQRAELFHSWAELRIA